MAANSEISTKNLRFAFWLNSAFVVFELIGGWYTNSLAIMSDAFHDFGDSASLGLAWYFQYLATRGRDDHYTYGYRRFSLLGALANGVLLVLGSAAIVIFAIQRFQEPQETVSEGIIVLAVVGVVVNYIALRQLQKGNSLNEKTIGLHFIADVLGWVAVLIGGLIIYFTDWYFIDPLLSILIAVYIIYGAAKSVMESVNIILQRVPKGIDVDEVEAALRGIHGVKEVVDLHVWTLDGERIILSVHLVVDFTNQREDLAGIRAEARSLLGEIGIRHSTIEINAPSEAYTDEPDN